MRRPYRRPNTTSIPKIVLHVNILGRSSPMCAICCGQACEFCGLEKPGNRGYNIARKQERNKQKAFTDKASKNRITSGKNDRRNDRPSQRRSKRSKKNQEEQRFRKDPGIPIKEMKEDHKNDHRIRVRREAGRKRKEEAKSNR